MSGAQAETEAVVIRQAFPLLEAGLMAANGEDAASCIAAMHGGVPALDEHWRVAFPKGAFIKVANAVSVREPMSSLDRALALCRGAMKDLFSALARRFSSGFQGTVATYLAAPLNPGLEYESFEGWMKLELGLYGLPAPVIRRHGHAGMAFLLREAMADLTAGRCDLAIVGGVDTSLDDAMLHRLVQAGSIHGGGHAWGMTPGEAAGFVALGAPGRGRASAAVLSLGIDYEPEGILGSGVCLAEGLTRAVQQALVALPERARISALWTDLNGEPFRSDELGKVLLRIDKRLTPEVELHHPADCWGDVGAATGVLCLVAAADPLERRNREEYALITLGSPLGERAAILVEVRPLVGQLRPLVSGGFDG